MSAEMSARRTAAAAVLADFKRETDRYLDDPAKATPRPDYSMWAWRLSSELGSVLQQLEAEDTGPVCACGHSERVHNAVAAAGVRGFCHECEPGSCGRYTPAGGTGSQAARQLGEIRLVLEAFDWETGDRQFALEQIGDIVNRSQA